MKKCFLLVAAVVTGSSLLAQDSTNVKQLDEAVVTANRFPQKQNSTGKLVTVIDSRMLRNFQGRSLAEVLNTTAGFFINGANNTPGTNLDVYFRGAGTGNLLVVIDGIPVYDPSQSNNVFDLNSIPLAAVERIEILKGGQSTVWGSDAVAGVIQVILKKNSSAKTAFNGSAAYGSYNSFRGNAGISGRVNALDYSVQYNYYKSKGFSAAYDSTGNNNFDKDGIEQNTLLAAVNYAISSRLKAKAFVHYDHYQNDLDAGAFTDDKDYTASNANRLSGFSLQYHNGGFSWNLQGSYQLAKRHFLDDSTIDRGPYSSFSEGKYTGRSTILETFGNGNICSRLQWVAGAQYVHQNTDQSYLSVSAWGPYKTALGKDSATTHQASAYASLLFHDWHRLNTEIGGRYNHHSIYGSNGTFTFNPSFNVDEHTKLFLNISSAYKTPTLYQLYSEYGNRKLKPENSITWEFGLQAGSNEDKMELHLAAFIRDIKNLIVFYTDPSFTSYYINRDSQHDYGVEAESSVQLATWGRWCNNIAFVEGKGTQDGKAVSNLYRRPKFTYNSALELAPCKGLTVVPALRYTGERLKGPYDPGPLMMPAYYLLDLFARYQVSNHASLFTDLRNITDQLYFDIPGYNSKRFNMMAGISINF